MSARADWACCVRFADSALFERATRDTTVLKGVLGVPAEWATETVDPFRAEPVVPLLRDTLLLVRAPCPRVVLDCSRSKRVWVVCQDSSTLVQTVGLDDTVLVASYLWQEPATETSLVNLGELGGIDAASAPPGLERWTRYLSFE